MITPLLTQIVQRWLEHSDPEKVRSWVYFSQFLIGAILIGGLVWLRDRGTDSGFKVREADLRKRIGRAAQASKSDQLAEARLERKSEPLRLQGIVIQGAPHQVLGISSQASESEVKASYRELMKRYHPDLIGRPGSREWQDAQKIAEAINQAKEKMLEAIRKK